MGKVRSRDSGHTFQINWWIFRELIFWMISGESLGENAGSAEMTCMSVQVFNINNAWMDNGCWRVGFHLSCILKKQTDQDQCCTKMFSVKKLVQSLNCTPTVSIKLESDTNLTLICLIIELTLVNNLLTESSLCQNLLTTKV